MNKTIINDIDVSECCCFENDRCLWTKRYYENNYVVPPCEAVKDCYFKQLKRLQEENKKLKEVANEAIIEHENLLINRNEFAERAEKYRQALEEIREMLETCLKFTTCEKCKFYKKCNKDIEECIITMINEVLK